MMRTRTCLKFHINRLYHFYLLPSGLAKSEATINMEFSISSLSANNKEIVSTADLNVVDIIAFLFNIFFMLFISKFPSLSESEPLKHIILYNNI
jgi:hypothetical protein